MDIIYQELFRHGLEELLEDKEFQKINPKQYFEAAHEAFYDVMANIFEPKENIESYLSPDLGFVQLQNILSSYKDEKSFYSKHYSRIQGNHDLVIVVPAKNEGKSIYYCLRSLINEVKKTKLKVYIVVCINNTIDDTLVKVDQVLQEVMIDNLTSRVLVFKEGVEVSLPSILNQGYLSLLESDSLVGNENDVYFCTYDGDAVVLNASKNSVFDIQIKELNSDPNLVLISGHSVDLRRKFTVFHHYANLATRPEIVTNLLPKPYTHGGGGGLYMRLASFPANLLSNKDLGGLSLNIIAHMNKSKEELKRIPFHKWIVRTNINTLTSHPTRTNFNDWLVTYKGYSKFRKKAQSILDPEVYDLWEAKRMESKNYQYSILYNMAENYFTLKEFAGYLLIKRYVYDKIMSSDQISREKLLGFSPRAHKNI
jgi:glycosyltransferase involved in cell wall biosynthesis